MNEMMKSKKIKTLILGIGNVLMGDEGVGVHVVRDLEKYQLPEGVELLDGGTGSFNLLDPMRNSEKIILIDATIDDNEIGTVQCIRPRFSKDYPRTLTAHDIGLKDLIDSFYLLGETPEVTLFAITIPEIDDLDLELSPEIAAIVPNASRLILKELTHESSLAQTF